MRTAARHLSKLTPTTFLNAVYLLTGTILLAGCATQHSELMKRAMADYRANRYEDALRSAVAALKLKPDTTRR